MKVDPKSFVQILFAIFSTTLMLPAYLGNTFASGADLDASYTVSLDRTEYKPGDTVIVKVNNSFYENIDTFVTIRKAASDDDRNTLRSYPNLEIVYNAKKTLVNYTAEFRYEIPRAANNNLFAEKTRYVVLLDDPSIVFEAPDLSTYKPVKVMFFTVNSEATMPFPLIFGIGVVIAGGIAFLTLRKHRQKAQI